MSTSDKFVGKAKEVTGKVTNDAELEAEGKTQHTKGKVKDAAEDAGDTARGIGKGLTGDDK